MKKLLFLFLFLFSLSFFTTQNVVAKVATVKQIVLKGKTQKNDPRSLLPVQAWVDGAVVHISCLTALENVVVSIKDESGKVVEEKTYASPQTIELPAMEVHGSYTLEVRYADTLLYGAFEIE